MIVKKIIHRSLAILCGLLFALILAEIILRIYNPFEFRVKADTLVLPENRHYLFKNTGINGLDPVITHTKNSLGFRGKEPPRNFNDYFTMITVGGSTTECLYLSDGKTWTDVLGKKLEPHFKKFWINNAGFDGQSTYGHLILMNEYLAKLKPNIVLFLVGQNDIGRADLLPYDKRMKKKEIKYYSSPKLSVWLAKHSELASLLLNIKRSRAVIKELAHQQIEPDKVTYLTIAESQIQQILDEHAKTYIQPYQARLEELIRSAKTNNIVPVFITQSALYGYGIDEATKINLATVKIGDANGQLQWELLQLYNTATKEVAKKNNILVIDLAEKMPKSSHYYYDYIHYTNEGAKKVAEIIYEEVVRERASGNSGQGTVVREQNK
ncbi:MAG: hypothetical protein A2Y62_17395 [Candidatus Fischerbacteria bacterium RBG_13_37_8]|uniref:SGNH hydrolase-type esterase domain-containing protein n=1 Tax=Candidatus Fischerbacteria bacterium RBG_13_37_8 TaxID=1817863 RepID=A0A1F5VN47_9BACT|nr:MAG: hypothetical protein A2Y62_17395 [Candidatus Fischerbacteria bacterium RBG_13_37_8]